MQVVHLFLSLVTTFCAILGIMLLAYIAELQIEIKESQIMTAKAAAIQAVSLSSIQLMIMGKKQFNAPSEPKEQEL